MPWAIIKTEPARELKAAAGFNGTETYIPMECRHYRQGRQRARKVKEIPILPRLLFVYTPYSWGLHDIIGRKYCTGLVRDPTGAAYIIPDPQMARFRETVTAWLSEAYEAYHKRLTPKSKRPRLKSFDDLKSYMDGLAKADAT